ncbi:MAG: hypothetical protein JXA41_09350 [Deltaproteobacteria bacterium]|nr:hypothetical protein [Deltaproteobacteria bacterium]
MKKKLYALPILLILLTFSGCNSKIIPAWQYESFGQLNNFKKNYLKGEDKIAELHFQKALAEVKRSGDLKRISKVYLTKYAVKVACLEDIEDSEYLDIEANQPDPENRNYFLFLKGNLSVVNVSLLPEQYRSFLKAGIGEKQMDINKEITGIGDPLSILIAIGIAVKNKLYSEETLQTAIEKASINGWYKPLVVYLEKLQQIYESNNEQEKAFKVQQKLKIIKN